MPSCDHFLDLCDWQDVRMVFVITNILPCVHFPDFCDCQDARILFVISNMPWCAVSWTFVIDRTSVCSSCFQICPGAPVPWTFVIDRTSVCSSCFQIILCSCAPVFWTFVIIRTRVCSPWFPICSHAPVSQTFVIGRTRACSSWCSTMLDICYWHGARMLFVISNMHSCARLLNFCNWQDEFRFMNMKHWFVSSLIDRMSPAGPLHIIASTGSLKMGKSPSLCGGGGGGSLNVPPPQWVASPIRPNLQSMDILLEGYWTIGWGGVGVADFYWLKLFSHGIYLLKRDSLYLRC